MHGRYSSEIAGLAAGEDVAFSVVTLIELAHGAARADTAERKTMRRQFLQELTTASRCIRSRFQSLCAPDRSTARARQRASVSPSPTC